jgi:hypothetical protein
MSLLSPMAGGRQFHDHAARGVYAEEHAVVRFSSVLLPGQSQLISVPLAIGERQQVLRIRRLGGQIEVARVPGAATSARAFRLITCGGCPKARKKARRKRPLSTGAISSTVAGLGGGLDC